MQQVNASLVLNGSVVGPVRWSGSWVTRVQTCRTGAAKVRLRLRQRAPVRALCVEWLAARLGALLFASSASTVVGAAAPRGAAAEADRAPLLCTRPSLQLDTAPPAFLAGRDPMSVATLPDGMRAQCNLRHSCPRHLRRRDRYPISPRPP